MVSMHAEGSGHLLSSQATGLRAGLGVRPGGLDQHAATVPQHPISALSETTGSCFALTPPAPRTEGGPGLGSLHVGDVGTAMP